MQFASAFGLNTRLHLHFAAQLSSGIQFIRANDSIISKESSIQNLPGNFHIEVEHSTTNLQN